MNNFTIFIPKKQFLSVKTRVEDRPHWKEVLEQNGIEVTSIGERSIRFRLTNHDVAEKRDLLKELFTTSCTENVE